MCIPPLCYGTPVTGQVSTSGQNVTHSYASTSPGGQSGIFAGKGGYDIEAKGGVELEGGAIVSQAPKEDNRLVAPSITYKDVVNHNDTSASSSSLSLGYGGGSMASTAFDNLTNNVLGNAFNGAGLPKDQHQTSVTQSVISPGKVTLTGTGNPEVDAQSQKNLDILTSRDPKAADAPLVNTLTIEDGKKIQAKQQEAQENALAARYLGGTFDNLIGDIAKAYDWPDGSLPKIALHGLSGLIQARVAGASSLVGVTAGALNEALLPEIENYLESQGIHRYLPDGRPNPDYARLLVASSTLVGAAIGAAAGGGVDTFAGASIANNATENNRLLHENEKKRIKELARGDTALEQDLTDVGCYLVHCSAGKSDDDPTKAGLQAREDAVARNEGGKYDRALGLMDASKNPGLFSYSDLDKTLDQRTANDPRSSGQYQGLTRDEQAKRDQALSACKDDAACKKSITASYQKTASDRAEQTVRTEQALQVNEACKTTQCLTDSLAELKRLDNDLKMQGAGPMDSDRIAIRAHMGSTNVQLGQTREAANGLAGAAIGVLGSEAGNAGGSKGLKGVKSATTATEFVDILSPADKQHILYGDGPGSGGHMYPGQPGKSTYPQSWTEGQILHNVGDVVTSPTTQWYAQTGTGGLTTKAGDPAKWVAWETRDGVSIRVVFEPATGRTITAFPDMAPTSTNLKPIKK